MVATLTINRLKKRYKKATTPTKTVLLCLLDRLQLRDRAIATSVIRRLLTMNQSKALTEKSKK
jgi:citrate lyase synthetase